MEFAHDTPTPNGEPPMDFPSSRAQSPNLSFLDQKSITFQQNLAYCPPVQVDNKNQTICVSRIKFKMSVKVIKKNAFDVAGIIKSTFNPVFDISISYPNYLTVASAMADAVTLLKPVMKVTDPKREKGTFLWFNANTPMYKFTEKTPMKDLEKFNTFYATFKKIHTFREFFAFADKLKVYLDYNDAERLSLGGNYRIIYNSASGGKSSRCYTPKNDKESLTFMKVIVALAGKIRKTIVQIDKSDRSTITLQHIFDKIIELVKKSNPKQIIPKNVTNIFTATYEALQTQMDEIYMSYIMTGSDLGMFAKLLQSLVQHLKDREGEKVVGESEEKDTELFKDLIGLLNGIKTSVVKELSDAEKSDLSEERMQELRQTMSAIDVISTDPDAAVSDIAKTIGI